MRDDLEDEVGAAFVDGEIAELVDYKQGWSEVSFELGFESVGCMGRGEAVDGIDGGCREDGVSLEAGMISQGRGEMGLSKSDASEKDDVGLVLEEFESEEVLDGHSVDVGGPAPLKVLEGFENREACKAELSMNGAIAPGVELAHGEVLEVSGVGLLVPGGEVGGVVTVLMHEAEFEALERGFEVHACGFGVFGVLIHGVGSS